MFYTAICSRCNTGLYGERTYYHSESECNAFLALRRKHKIPLTTRTDQEDLQNALKKVPKKEKK